MVLVVEDQPNLRAIVLKMLAKLGHEAVGAATGEEGLERCAEHGASLRVLLVDLCLPGIDGTEMVARFRQSSSTPVVFMSGGAPRHLLERALACGDGFLKKPLTLSELQGALEPHLS